MIRDIGRDTPGAAPGLAKSSSKGGDFGARKRSMKGAGYYGEVFAVRETGPVVPASSGVWVELRTNVIVSIISSLFLCFAFGFAFLHICFLCCLHHLLATLDAFCISLFLYDLSLLLAHLVSDFKLTCGVIYIAR